MSRLLAAGLLLVTLLLAPAAAAAVAADDDAAAVQWSVVPASAEGADGRLSLRHSIDPGATVTDHLEVTNLGDVAAVFTVAAGDGRVGAEGAFDLAPGAPVDSGTWITVDGLVDGTLELEAGQSAVLQVTIAVPADASPGDHPAGIVVGHSQGQGVTVTQRIGVRAHLQVTGELTPALAVSDVSADYSTSWNPFAPGTLTVTYRVENTGNVRLGAAGSMTVSGLVDEGAAALPEATELLPGESRDQTLSVPWWPAFSASGELLVTPISLGEDRITPPVAQTVEFGAATVPWTALLVLVLLIGLVVLLVLRRRRRHRRAVSTAVERELVAAAT